MASAKKSKSRPSKKPAAKAKVLVEPSTRKAAAKPAITKTASKAGKTKPAKTKSAKPTTSKSAPSPAARSDGIGVGSRAPSFTLKDQAGKELSSKTLAGSPYVLYFYPKDDTTGCTTQACGFRDSFAAFGRTKARVIGVSPDSEASHARFAGKYGLPFTLLADPDKTLANAYGVWGKKQNYGREYLGITRSTFVVDGKGVVQKVWRGVKVDGHVATGLEAVKTL
jgi:thioredoxin-dependent peroxiredoxin